MQFELDSEQELLRDSVRRWVEKKYPFNQRQKIRDLPKAFAPENWKEMAELGWLAVSLPEEAGGLGQSIVESCLIAEELGRGLILEPYVQVSVLAAQLISHATSGVQREELLGELMAGEKIIAAAHHEHQSPGNLSFVKTSAEQAGGGWSISGRKALVFAGDAANSFVVSARVDGDTNDENGIALFVVDASATGLTRRDFRTVDGTHASDLTLTNVTVPTEACLGKPGDAYAAIEAAHQLAIAVLCAEAVGMMEHALEMTCEHLRTRQQFGVPIGTFQTLQHRAADMYLETQVGRAAVWRALDFLANGNADQKRQAVSSAKAQVGRTARYVCSQAIQCHGGIAITEEFPIGHYYKRMTVFDLTFGNTNIHLRNLARAMCQSKAA